MDVFYERGEGEGRVAQSDAKQYCASLSWGGKVLVVVLSVGQRVVFAA